jgi:probable rRNA maturation factor
MDLEINIFNSSSARFLPKKKIITVLKNTFKSEKIKRAVISLIYLDDVEIQKLNKEFLNHDYPTDVLSFSLEEDLLEGEIYIGIDTARLQAEDYKVSLTNEIMRLAVHGALHIIGYNDSSPSEKEKMHILENKYISLR